MTTRKPLRARQLCWCGCKTEISAGSYFARGHDKIAEAALLAAKYDSTVPRILAEHGFGPDNPVIEAAVTNGDWERCPACGHHGNDTTMRYHQAMHAKSGREPWPFFALFNADDEYGHRAAYVNGGPAIVTQCGLGGQADVINPNRTLICRQCGEIEAERQQT